MSDRRIIIEMGMGNDLHGGDYTRAAIRAVEDAIRHSSLPLLGTLDLDPGAMRVKVTIGVQMPEAVDEAAVAAHLPHGEVEVTVVKGGLDPAGGIVIASAAVEAFLPSQGGEWVLDRAGN